MEAATSAEPATQKVGDPVEHAELAVVGLAEDSELWELVDTVHERMRPGLRDRLRPLTWEQTVDSLVGTSLAEFGRQFRERYLDLRQVDGH